MALSWAERCSVSSRWWSAELMDAPSKAPDKKPAAPPPSERLGEAEKLQLANIQQHTHRAVQGCSKKKYDVDYATDKCYVQVIIIIILFLVL